MTKKMGAKLGRGQILSKRDAQWSPRSVAGPQPDHKIANVIAEAANWMDSRPKRVRKRQTAPPTSIPQKKPVVCEHVRRSAFETQMKRGASTRPAISGLQRRNRRRWPGSPRRSAWANRECPASQTQPVEAADRRLLAASRNDRHCQNSPANAPATTIAAKRHPPPRGFARRSNPKNAPPKTRFRIKCDAIGVQR